MENVISLFTHVASVLEKFHKSGKPVWSMSRREKLCQRFANQAAKQYPNTAPKQEYLKK